ncbi:MULTISPECIES: ABC transporter substrate binding protein [unclassified Maridesulfovibrio]|uniref:ABC transporter substrate binding protein n=1 Tax=unclassified Maridesulfovibrio TaxID=2794999 RepID=UPI003B3F44FA
MTKVICEHIRGELLRLCWLAVFFLFMVFPARAEDVRHVLVLHSYHSGMSWVANIEKGIRDTLLVPPYNDLVLHIEYMDTKRHYSAKHYARIKNLLEAKFKSINLSLILSSDNNAFDFLLENRNELFPGVPMVFCGVNNFSDDQIKGVKGITGVAEVMSSRETVECILKQLPETKSIYVVNDYLKTGRAWEATIKRNLAPFKDRVSIEYNDNLTIAGLREKIQSMKSGSVVLLGVYYSDRDGKYVTYEKLGSILTQNSPVPVYCLLRFNLRDGVIGGKVISGYHQGVMMSEVAHKVLDGEKTDDIPVIKIGANAFIFDWQSLNKYGIPIESLPEESVVLNEPFSFYEEYFYLVWSTVFVFAFMIVLVIVLIKNVIALHKARKDLEHSEIKYRSIFDNAQEGIFQTSVEGRVLAANAAFAAIFGYDSPEEVIEVVDNVGKKLYLNEVDRNALLAAMQETGTLSGFEVKMKCKGGEIVWITMNARKTTDLNGKVIFEGSIVDISERKLNEQRIIQSEKMMSVGGLAAGMAHEINNPLAAIVGAVQNLQKRLASESKKNIMIAEECGISFSAITEYLERRDCLKFLDGIYESGLRAATIVRGMLSFSRKSGSDFASHNLSSIVENALSLIMKDYDYNRNYDFRKIKIIKEFDSPNSLIKCDEVEIQQVVLNLLKNGAEAMGEKSYVEDGPCFVLRIREYMAMAVLEIEDNGPGMDEEVRKRILEPFYTTKSVGKGTGLGLSISYFIITRRHNGSMEVFSEPGKGTRFVVRLPLYKG